MNPAKWQRTFELEKHSTSYNVVKDFTDLNKTTTQN